MKVLLGCVLSLALLPGLPVFGIRACGQQLIKIVKVVCNGRGIHSEGSGGLTFQRTYYVDIPRKRSSYFNPDPIVSLCCYTTCSLSDIEQYCASPTTRRTTTTTTQSPTTPAKRDYLYGVPPLSLKLRNGSYGHEQPKSGRGGLLPSAKPPNPIVSQADSAPLLMASGQSSGKERARLLPPMMELLTYVSNMVNQREPGNG